MKKVGLLVIMALVGMEGLWGQSNPCQDKYIWAVWNKFSGTSATAALNYAGVNIGMTMTSNFSFGSTPSIFGYTKFNGFSSVVPNTTVPETTWAAGVGGTTTMCFSQTVTNPILLLASLGAPGLTVSLSFSQPYIVVYDGGGMSYASDGNGCIEEANATVSIDPLPNLSVTNPASVCTPGTVDISTAATTAGSAAGLPHHHCL